MLHAAGARSSYPSRTLKQTGESVDRVHRSPQELFSTCVLNLMRELEAVDEASFVAHQRMETQKLQSVTVCCI
jgi:hypothetical protein